MDVRSAVDARPLRFVHFVDFTRFNPQAGPIASAGGGFGHFTQADCDYVGFMARYRQGQLDRIPPADAEKIGKLRRYFETHPGENEVALGGRLRRVNILMDLSRLHGDITSLQSAYREVLGDAVK